MRSTSTVIAACHNVVVLVGTLKTVFIDRDLQIRKDGGVMLCLVYDDPLRIAIEKGHRVSLYICQRSSMLKADVWQLWKLLTAQRGLT